jgi:flavin-dependent dehydrogenase
LIIATDISVDVVIVGAGPAGAATALMLSPFVRTLLLDHADLRADREAGARIGESLPAAAHRILRDMGLWNDFLHQGHATCYGSRSIWGGAEPVCADSIRDPDGPGWHLDRARFDAWLRAWACQRGATLRTPARVVTLRRDGADWRLSLLHHGQSVTVACRYVIDAGGRRASVVRMLGRRPTSADRLVCRWIHGASQGDYGTTVVEAEPDGWWYTAALPGGRRVLAFHTDADLTAAKTTVTSQALLARARTQSGVGPLLAITGFEAQGIGGNCGAQTSWLGEVTGQGWIAVGDAALACDPLSSQGLLNALYSALLAAGAVRQALAGDPSGLDEYQAAINDLSSVYRAHLMAWYALERRWSDRLFWLRRHGSVDCEESPLTRRRVLAPRQATPGGGAIKISAT